MCHLQSFIRLLLLSLVNKSRQPKDRSEACKTPRLGASGAIPNFAVPVNTINLFDDSNALKQENKRKSFAKLGISPSKRIKRRSSSNESDYGSDYSVGTNEVNLSNQRPLTTEEAKNLKTE